MATTATMAAAIAATNHPNSPYSHQKRPTPLHLYDDDDVVEPRMDGRPRSLSLGSNSSASEDSPLSALDSTAALILVHDDDSQESPTHFEFSDDEDGGDPNDDIVNPVFEIRRTSIPPLPPRTIFLYLLAPFLKLGVLNILPAGELPLKYGLPTLFILAIMSAFSRQVWYLLVRYLRKADLMDILCETYAKARGKERRREIVRLSVKVGTAAFNALISILYLHESVHVLLPYLPPSTFPRILIIALCGSSVFFLSSGPSLASKRVVFASWLSILTYLAWLSCVMYAHAKGVMLVDDHGTPSVWKGILTVAFTFCTSSTLPLYASLKSGSNPISTAKKPRSRSFRILSVLSIFCATLLILPVVIFAALPNAPSSRSLSLQPPPPNDIIPKIPADPSVQQVRTALASLSAAVLFLGTPQPLLTIPVLPIRIARANINLTRTFIIPAIIVLTLALTLLTPDSDSRVKAVTVMTLTAVALALLSTYIVPCILHISVHFFKRPVSIVIPRTPMLPTPSTAGLPSAGSLDGEPSARGLGATDELLQRKERALRKKQFRKRIVWDVGVWLQLGVCAVGAVVAASQLVSR